MMIFRASCALVIIITMAMSLVAFFRDINTELGLGLLGIAGLAFAALVFDQLEREVRALRRVVVRLTEERKKDEPGDQGRVAASTSVRRVRTGSATPSSSV